MKFNVLTRMIGKFKRDRVLKYYRNRKLPEISSDESFVLLDGLWGHLSHWNRVHLLGSALVMHYNAKPLALIHSHDKNAKKILKSMGVLNFFEVSISDEIYKSTQQFFQEKWSVVRTGQDILNLELPFSVPSGRLYDFIIKKQQRAEPDFEDERMESLVREFVTSIYCMEKIFEKHTIRAVQSSHTIGSFWSPLVWLSIKNKVPAYITDNLYGTLRLSRILEEEDYFRAVDCPDPEAIEILQDCQKEKIIEIGKKTIEDRFSGKGTDVASKFAYQGQFNYTNKKELCDRFGWEVEKPIVLIMTSNWFDYPHTFKFTYFENILDWYKTTLNTIYDSKDIQWLVKPHPAEHRWYGGPDATKMVKDVDNVKVFPSDLSGQGVLDSIDGIVSPYGTAGIEYAAAGKKVLIIESSFYSPWNFVLQADSREDYIEKLKNFDKLELPNGSMERSWMFAGMYFSNSPSKPFYNYPCDAERGNLLNLLPKFYEEQGDKILEEIEQINHWLKDGRLWSYHTYKFLDC